MESSMEDRAYMDSLFVAGEVPKDVQHSVRLQSYFNQADKIIECAQWSLIVEPSQLSRTRHALPEHPTAWLTSSVVSAVPVLRRKKRTISSKRCIESAAPSIPFKLLKPDRSSSPS